MNAVGTIEQVLEVAPHKAAAVRPPTSHLENYYYIIKLVKSDMRNTAWEVGTSS